MGGAPLAQVHLDRLQVPAIAKAPGDEIHRVALQRPLCRQRLPYRLAVAHQLGPVGLGHREAAAQVGLAAGAAQHLLMAREHLHQTWLARCAGMNRALHAW